MASKRQFSYFYHHYGSAMVRLKMHNRRSMGKRMHLAALCKCVTFFKNIKDLKMIQTGDNVDA